MQGGRVLRVECEGRLHQLARLLGGRRWEVQRFCGLLLCLRNRCRGLLTHLTEARVIGTTEQRGDDQLPRLLRIGRGDELVARLANLAAANRCSLRRYSRSPNTPTPQAIASRTTTRPRRGSVARSRCGGDQSRSVPPLPRRRALQLETAIVKYRRQWLLTRAPYGLPTADRSAQPPARRSSRDRRNDELWCHSPCRSSRGLGSLPGHATDFTISADPAIRLLAETEWVATTD